MTKSKFILKLIGGVVYSVAIFAGLLFLGAWTFRWWRAWVFLGVVLVASSATMFGIFPSRPELLDERYKAPIQKGQPFSDKVLTPLARPVVPWPCRIHSARCVPFPGAGWDWNSR